MKDLSSGELPNTLISLPNTTSQLNDRLFAVVAECNLHCFSLLKLTQREDRQMDFEVLFANQKLTNLLQIERGGIIGKYLSQIYPFSENWIQCGKYFRALETNLPLTEEFPLDIFGRTRWYRHEIVPIRSTLIAVTAEDITKRKKLEKQLIQTAYFDELTGLRNRQALLKNLDSSAHSGDQVCLILFDIDRFREINLCYGSSAGDELLVAFSNALRNLSIGTCYRLAADSFAVIVAKRVGQIAVGEASAAKWLRILSQIYEIGSHSICCSVSAGSSVAIGQVPVDQRQLLVEAEIALAVAKTRSSPKYLPYFGAIMDAHEQRLRIGRQLPKSIAEDEFVAFYQPQYDLNSNRIVGCEALCRWLSEELGSIAPDDFIEIAEQMNLLARLDLKLLQKVVRFFQNIPVAQANFSLSVNASPNSLQSTSYVDTLIQMAKSLPVWCRLEVEITENAIISDNQLLRQTLFRLLDADVGVALDDFGSGYSNLNYLSRFPFEKLKLDRCLIKDIETNPRNMPLLTGAIELAHRLGLKVVAEGIETPYQQQWLREVGCDLGQGFHLCKPLPESDSRNLFVGSEKC